MWDITITSEIGMVIVSYHRKWHHCDHHKMCSSVDLKTSGLWLRGIQVNARSTLPDGFWQPIRRRRFTSALVAILSLQLFPRLDPNTQQKVENELSKIFTCTSEMPYVAWRDMAGQSSATVAILRGIAMARLNLPTGIDDLPWEAFVSRSWLRYPMQAAMSFRRFSKITDEAADLLRSKGLTLDQPTDYGHRWRMSMRAR